MKFEQLTAEELKLADTAYEDALDLATQQIKITTDRKTRNFAINTLLDAICTRDHHARTIEALKEDLDFKLPEISNYIKNWKSRNRFGATPIDTKDALDLWFDHYAITIDLRNNVKTNRKYDGDVMDAELFAFEQIKNVESLYCRFIVDLVEHSPIKSTKDVISAVWSTKVAKEYIRHQAAMYSAVKHDPNSVAIGNVELRKFVKAFLNSSESDFDLALQAIRSFIWQVKRKMIGAKVTDHNMTVFVGEQGAGKSTFMMKLIAPLDAGSAGINFDQLGDDRYASIFNSPVLYTDEMSFLSKIDAGHLKNLMTTETLSHRQLYARTVSTIAQKSTFIGAANESLSTIFFDSTGMRRFIELHCLSNSSANWAGINTVDFEAIWKSVDEALEVNPINSVRHILEVVQEEMRQKSPVEDWLIGFLCGNDINYAKKYTSKHLFKEYASDYFSSNYPNHRIDTQKFANQLGDLFRKDAYNNVVNKLTTRSADGVQFRFEQNEVDRFERKVTCRLRAEDMLDTDAETNVCRLRGAA